MKLRNKITGETIDIASEVLSGPWEAADVSRPSASGSEKVAPVQPKKRVKKNG